MGDSYVLHTKFAMETMFVLVAILCLMFLSIIVHTCRGSEFQLNYIVSALLIAYLVFLALGFILIPYWFAAAYPCLFNAYYLLAHKYSKTAYELPILLIKKEPVPEPGPCWHSKITFVIMLCLNTVIPAVEGYIYAKSFENIANCADHSCGEDDFVCCWK